jgi:diguanylate cyclase (GGDEF)-like protein
MALPISVAHMALDRADRIRTNLAQRRIRTEGTEIQVTASIGLAFAPPGRTRNEMALIMTADEALYQAKAEGRNRLVFGHHAMQISPRQTESAEFASLV